MTAAQLETLQEVIIRVTLVVFAMWCRREPIRWNIEVGFVLIAAGAGFVFASWASDLTRGRARAARRPGGRRGRGLVARSRTR